MGPIATRQVILLPFPFSDLSASKLRPALLLAAAGAQSAPATVADLETPAGAGL